MKKDGDDSRCRTSIWTKRRKLVIIEIPVMREVASALGGGLARIKPRG